MAKEAFDVLYQTALLVSTVAIGLSSLGEANALRRVSLRNDGEEIQLGNFSPWLFNAYLSSNVSYWVYGQYLNDPYVSIACGITSLAFVYYVITIINVLNRPLIPHIDSVEANVGHSTRTAVIDGEEGSLRAIFRAFDYQIDEMNPADRDRIYERRKAEILFFFVITFWIFFGALVDTMDFDEATKVNAIAMISSIHSVMVGASHLKTIHEMITQRDASKFSVPMQVAIILNLALWTFWSIGKRFIVTFTLGTNLGISLLKVAVFMYLRSSTHTRKDQAGGLAPPPALTITTTDDMGNVMQERRLSFSVPSMDISGGAEDRSVMSTAKYSVDAESPDRALGIEMETAPSASSSSGTGIGISAMSANRTATFYESIPENALTTPLDGDTKEGITASEGVYKATPSDTYWKGEKERTENHNFVDNTITDSNPESISAKSPDEWIIPTLPAEKWTKEGAVVEQREQQLEQRVPFS